MGYEDFVFFFLSEEDKSTEAAIRYWFNVCDIDGDGLLSAQGAFWVWGEGASAVCPHAARAPRAPPTPRRRCAPSAPRARADMRHFYGELLQRMRNFGVEPVKFEDVFCQMCDLCRPARDGHIALADMLHRERAKLTGVFFSCMWNWHKLSAFDARDPMLVKQELNLGGVSQWHRYAAVEYARLASEEEGGGGGGGGGGAGAGGYDAAAAYGGSAAFADADAFEIS
jgi:serine/threonine-protein phosphatase 2A regulatory subunit B''